VLDVAARAGQALVLLAPGIARWHGPRHHHRDDVVALGLLAGLLGLHLDLDDQVHLRRLGQVLQALGAFAAPGLHRERSVRDADQVDLGLHEVSEHLGETASDLVADAVLDFVRQLRGQGAGVRRDDDGAGRSGKRAGAGKQSKQGGDGDASHVGCPVGGSPIGVAQTALRRRASWVDSKGRLVGILGFCVGLKPQHAVAEKQEGARSRTLLDRPLGLNAGRDIVACRVR
jgi:hypothetical protein